LVNARILRYDRIATELPPPNDPDPAGAAAVQELMGGRFGEMSTLLELHLPLVQLPRPTGRPAVYDLVANIAAKEFGHVELVATAINTMLTGASPTSNGSARAPPATREPLADVKGVGNPQHFIAGGHGALPQNSRTSVERRLVFSSGDGSAGRERKAQMPDVRQRELDPSGRPLAVPGAPSSLRAPPPDPAQPPASISVP
jgi:Mn-containing catalase